jgi:hypothetical protein
MRTKEELELVERLHRAGLNKSQIARHTGIPRGTVRDWLSGRAPRSPLSRDQVCPSCGHAEHDFGQLPDPEYAYLLGVYLGDGYIATSAKGVHVLRLFQDMAYPDLIEAWAACVQTIMPRNSVNVQYNVGGGACACIISWSKSWPCLLPQHGRGRKHERRIALTAWQSELVSHDPRPLVAGLMHSDGCRVINKVAGREYPRHLFVNASQDIRSIFCGALDQLGIEWRQSKERTISIARRQAVADLDSVVGFKS